MQKEYHIVGFAGSLRKESYNRRLLEVISDLIPEGITYETFELNDIPLFNEDLEQEGFPPAVSDFRSALQNADALLIASPDEQLNDGCIKKCSGLGIAFREQTTQPPGPKTCCDHGCWWPRRH